MSNGRQAIEHYGRTTVQAKHDRLYVHLPTSDALDLGLKQGKPMYRGTSVPCRMRIDKDVFDIQSLAMTVYMHPSVVHANHSVNVTKSTKQRQMSEYPAPMTADCRLPHCKFPSHHGHRDYLLVDAERRSSTIRWQGILRMLLESGRGAAKAKRNRT
jgi:hypothetical protein